MYRHLHVMCAICMLAMPLGTVCASSTAAGPRIEVTQLMRAHPIGLAWWLNAGWRASLSRSSNLFLRGTYAESGHKAMVSPASIHPGLYVKIMPITPIVIDVEAQQLRFFGLFGTVTDYPTLTPDWSPTTRDGPITQGRHETGWRVNAKATLQPVWPSIHPICISKRMALDEWMMGTVGMTQPPITLCTRRSIRPDRCHRDLRGG